MSGKGDYGMSFGSYANLYESFTGIKVDRTVLVQTPEKNDVEKIDSQLQANIPKKKKGAEKNKSKEKVKKGTRNNEIPRGELLIKYPQISAVVLIFQTYMIKSLVFVNISCFKSDGNLQKHHLGT